MSGIGEQIGGQIGEKTDEEIGGETGCRERARAEQISTAGIMSTSN